MEAQHYIAMHKQVATLEPWLCELKQIVLHPYATICFMSKYKLSSVWMCKGLWYRINNWRAQPDLYSHIHNSSTEKLNSNCCKCKYALCDSNLKWKSLFLISISSKKTQTSSNFSLFLIVKPQNSFVHSKRQNSHFWCSWENANGRSGIWKQSNVLNFTRGTTNTLNNFWRSTYFIWDKVPMLTVSIAPYTTTTLHPIMNCSTSIFSLTLPKKNRHFLYVSTAVFQQKVLFLSSMQRKTELHRTLDMKCQVT